MSQTDDYQNSVFLVYTKKLKQTIMLKRVWPFSNQEQFQLVQARLSLAQFCPSLFYYENCDVLLNHLINIF